MSFFNELKRRNVFKVAAAYIIVGWLIMQAGDTMAPALHLPEWVNSLLAFFLILGFPLAMFFAWAYEMTPDGIRKEKEIDRSKSITRQTSRKLDFMIIGVMVVALMYFAWDKFVAVPAPEVKPTQTAAVAEQAITDTASAQQKPDNKSIAVLPFVNMSSDPEQEYFSDGLSEELLNLLTKIPDLRVTSRSSAFSFKGQNLEIREIARRLNVTHILEGSVRKAGNQVRITAQLIETSSDTHLWSETYDRSLDNIFAIQDDIATAVVDALKVSLMVGLPDRRKTDPEVYALYLQGQYFINLRNKESLEKGVLAFEQALEIDPEYAPAWVGLSRAIQNQTRDAARLQADGSAQAMNAVEKALELDENLASAWATLAYLKRSYEWDWKGAREAINMAMSLEPNNVEVLGAAASLSTTFGETNRATELFELITDRDPLDLAALRALGIGYTAQGRMEDAFEVFNRILAISPDHATAQLDIARMHIFQGKFALALEEIDRGGPGPGYFKVFLRAIVHYSLGDETSSQTHFKEYVDKYGEEFSLGVVAIHAWRGENDFAFEWLEVAYEKRSPFLYNILSNVWIKGLHNDPRYPVFLKKMGLLEYWDGPQSE